MSDLPKRLLNGRDRIARRGGIVLVHFGPDGGETQYQLLDGGCVTKPMLDKLVAAGLLKPQDDGLICDAPQTYRVA